MSGRLPPGWAETTLPELISKDGIFTDGDWVESKDQDPDGDVRLIQLADVGDGEYRDRSSRFLTLQKANELGCTFLQPNDVLVARMPDPLGRACVFPGDPKASVTVVDVCVIRPGEVGPNPRWLVHVLNAPQSRSAMSGYEKGTTRKRISRRNLGLVGLPLPPRAEQDRIVSAIEEQLTRLASGLTALDRAERLLDVWLGSAMEAAYHSALRLDPESQQCSLMEICSLVTKGTTPTSVGYQYQDEGIRFVKVESLVDGHIDQSKCAYISDAAHANLARSQMQAGDVLVSIAGTLGRVGIVSKQDVPANTNQALAIVRLNDPRLAPYVKAFLELPSTQYQLRSGGKGVGMSNLTLQQIREIQIAIPRTEVRRSWLDAVDATKETFRRIALCLATNRMKAQQLRAAILRSAYSGTLVPQYSSDEPASDLLRRIAADRATSAEQVPKRIRHTHTTVPETTSG